MPRSRARGRFFCGFCTSAAANVGECHESAEKSEPTSADPNVMTNSELHCGEPANQFVPKFAVTAAGLRPIVRASSTSAASETVLMTVSVVCTSFPSLTPRRLIQVSTQIVTRAASRCGESPRSIADPSDVCSVMCGNHEYVSAVTAGQRTPRNFPNPTATAAIVPV